MNKVAEMKKLNKQMSACRKCALRAECKQVVPGAGSAKAKIMFIGEAPGKKEDESGVPFVGAAGKFLDEMLGIIDLKREDVYIANAIKCRPPQNRDPLPEEKEICREWLEKQIRVIQPKLIVTLGRHSMNLFFPEQKISEVHGKALRKENVVNFSMFSQFITSFQWGFIWFGALCAVIFIVLFVDQAIEFIRIMVG